MKKDKLKRVVGLIFLLAQLVAFTLLGAFYFCFDFLLRSDLEKLVAALAPIFSIYGTLFLKDMLAPEHAIVSPGNPPHPSEGPAAENGRSRQEAPPDTKAREPVIVKTWLAWTLIALMSVYCVLILSILIGRAVFSIMANSDAVDAISFTQVAFGVYVGLVIDFLYGRRDSQGQ